MKINRHHSSAENSLDWYVLQTKPKQEFRVLDNLQRQNIGVFCPKMREESFVFGKRRSKVVPVFPQYVFVRLCFDTMFDNVRWAVGVKSVVTSGSEPVRVDRRVIETLRVQMSEGDLLELDFQENQKVKVIRGPFKELQGVFLRRMSGIERVMVLLKVMGSDTRVQLHPSSLRAV